MRTLTLVDDNLPARNERTIEVILQYPTEGGSAEQDDDTAITDARRPTDASPWSFSPTG